MSDSKQKKIYYWADSDDHRDVKVAAAMRGVPISDVVRAGTELVISTRPEDWDLIRTYARFLQAAPQEEVRRIRGAIAAALEIGAKRATHTARKAV